MAFRAYRVGRFAARDSLQVVGRPLFYLPRFGDADFTRVDPRLETAVSHTQMHEYRLLCICSNKEPLTAQ